MGDERGMNNNEFIGLGWEVPQQDLEYFHSLNNLELEMHSLSIGERFTIMDELLEKMKKSMVDNYELLFTTEEFNKYMSCSRSLSCHRYLGGAKEEFFGKFFIELGNILTSTILPPLRGKKGEELLRGFLDMWNKYKKMSAWLITFFKPADRTDQSSTSGFAVEKMTMLTICGLFDVLWTTRLKETITFMIKQERDGMLIVDPDLFRRTSEFCIKIQKMRLKSYYTRLEETVLAETTGYYSNLASKWLTCSTFGEYIKKACLSFEKERRLKASYLNDDLMMKVLKAVREELIDKHAKEVAWLIPEMGVGIMKL